jgi:hypothetical protein
VLVTVLGGLVISLLRLSPRPIITHGLFDCGAILFIGVLISTALALDAAKWSTSASNTPIQDARNYNKSDEVRKYIDAYDAYTPPSGPPLLIRRPSRGADECGDFDFLAKNKAALTKEGGATLLCLSLLLQLLATAVTNSCTAGERGGAVHA